MGAQVSSEKKTPLSARLNHSLANILHRTTLKSPQDSFEPLPINRQAHSQVLTRIEGVLAEISYSEEIFTSLAMDAHFAIQQKKRALKKVRCMFASSFGACLVDSKNQVKRAAYNGLKNEITKEMPALLDLLRRGNATIASQTLPFLAGYEKKYIYCATLLQTLEEGDLSTLKELLSKKKQFERSKPSLLQRNMMRPYESDHILYRANEQWLPIFTRLNLIQEVTETKKTARIDSKYYQCTKSGQKLLSELFSVLPELAYAKCSRSSWLKSPASNHYKKIRLICVYADFLDDNDKLNPKGLGAYRSAFLQLK